MVVIRIQDMHEDCEHYERFQPGTSYSRVKRGFPRWYNPVCFPEVIPSNLYDPMVLRKALGKAVIKRLTTDVPFDLLLSGGLDSSLVASITALYLPFFLHVRAEECKPKWEGKASIKLSAITAKQAWPLLEDFCNIHKLLPIDTCYHTECPPG